MFLLRSITAVLFVFLSSACNSKLNKTPAAAGNGTTAVGSPIAVPAAELSFANVFTKVIKTNCFSCHASPRNASGINLETYASVLSNRVAIAQAVESKFMPESQGRVMPDDQRELLLRWLAAGAPFESMAKLNEGEIQ